jgi:D-alanyl-D-alanine carboxypeptidase
MISVVKRLLSGFLFLMTLAPLYGADYNAVLVADMDSGKIIYSENADDLNYPASLTKIMTLYLTFNALEYGRLRSDQNLIVSKTAANARPVKIGLPAGSKITVENAIKAVAVYSANDMAVVLSENLTGDEGDFASMMTKTAKEIGLKNTNFSNASGLSDDEHISTAKDMALLSMAIKKHYPEYWSYFSIPYFSYNGKSYKNGNELLGAYDGCDGMKTGFTNKSGYSLVSTAKQGGRHLVSVVLGANGKRDRTAISRALLDFGFGKTDRFSVQTTGKYASSPAPQSRPRSAAFGGGAGVQFGAFGSERGAKLQQEKVYALFELDTYLEKFNGMFRVRAKMSESQAQKIKSQCASSGVDCYVFH